MTLSISKGKELEDSVHAIERHILVSSPALRENSFTIQSRKHVDVAGVHHEIDIWVEVDLGRGYRSLFIFECKNWQEAVGKNEIIIFSEKINALKAQHGFLVAKSFTKDAEAQASKDSRLTLLIATENDPRLTPVPFNFHYTFREDATKAQVTLKHRGSTGVNVESIDPSATIQIGGEARPLREYMNDWLNEIYSDRMRTFNSILPEGVYPLEAEAKRLFEPGECSIAGKEIESAVADVKFAVRVIPGSVISDYEVATRGRALRLAPVEGHGVALQVIFSRLD